MDHHHASLSVTVFLPLLFAITIPLGVSAQSPAHPWPIKDFWLIRMSDGGACDYTSSDGRCWIPWEWVKGLFAIPEMEGDLASAAGFYEAEHFRPPNLLSIQAKDRGSVYAVWSDQGMFEGIDEAIAAYLSDESCYEGGVARRQRAQEILRSLDEITVAEKEALARGKAMSLVSFELPRIVSSPTVLATSSRAIVRHALPHELFHAVQHAYPSFAKSSLCGRMPAWFVEAMTDAMSLDWLEANYEALYEQEESRERLRGWRGYNYPLDQDWELIIKDPNARLVQEYGASSFWRYLGRDVIRQVLETPVGSVLKPVDWLDQTLRENWTDICERLSKGKDGSSSGLPIFGKNDKRLSCQEASAVAGLYLLYPMFMARFVEEERSYAGALSHMFLPKEKRGVERGLGEKRVDGCLVPEFDDDGLEVLLPPLASECVRVPTAMAGKYDVAAVLPPLLTPAENDTPKGKPPEPEGIEDIHLSWEGRVHTGAYFPTLAMKGVAGVGRPKIWLMTGQGALMNANRDLLLVFSNVSPDPSNTEPKRIQVHLLQDSGRKYTDLKK